MKRVLFITHIFPPQPAGGAIRSGQCAKYLPSLGWIPTVLTVKLPAKSQVDQQMLEELPLEVSVVRTLSFDSAIYMRGVKYKGEGQHSRILDFVKHLFSLFLIPDRQILWFPMAFIAGCKILAQKSHQLIYVTYSPATNLLLGYLLKKIFHKPFVIDFRDLWVGYPLITFPTKFHRIVLQLLEKLIVQAADKIVTVAEPMSQYFLKKYGLSRDRVITITNGYDPEDRQRFINTWVRRNQKFTIVYTGSVYGVQNPNMFLHALSQMLAQNHITSRDFQVKFVGNLDESVPAKYHLGDVVKTYNFVPHKKVLDFLIEADVLLLINSRVYWGEITYSAKLFDYLMTGKPILALSAQDSITAQLLQDAGVGIVVEPEDILGMQKAILELYERWKNNALRVSPNQAVINRFDRRVLTSQLAGVFNKAIRQMSSTE